MAHRAYKTARQVPLHQSGAERWDARRLQRAIEEREAKHARASGGESIRRPRLIRSTAIHDDHRGGDTDQAHATERN